VQTLQNVAADQTLKVIESAPGPPASK